MRKPMNDFKFSCPHCDQRLRCDAQFSGCKILCPICNHLIYIPCAPGITVELQPDPGMSWATHIPHARAGPAGRLAVSGKSRPDRK